MTDHSTLIPYAVLCVAPGQTQVGMLPVRAQNPSLALEVAAQQCLEQNLEDLSFVGVLAREDLNMMIQALDEAQ